MYLNNRGMFSIYQMDFTPSGIHQKVNPSTQPGNVFTLVFPFSLNKVLLQATVGDLYYTLDGTIPVSNVSNPTGFILAIGSDPILIINSKSIDINIAGNGVLQYIFGI